MPWKHIEGVIDAVAASPDISLAIVGDGPLRMTLAHRAGEKLPGRDVLTGMLSHADTLAVMKVADVFVLNSSYEGLSHLLIEALALGVPVVATRAGGNSEVVADEENGLLVPVGDTQALAASLKRLLSDEELRARLSTRARESAKRFSTEVMLSATVTVLQNL